MLGTVQSERLHLGAQVAGLSALGFSSVDDLFSRAAPAASGTESPDDAGRSRLRLLLPGTPLEASGPLSTRRGGPGGVGTGWIRIERWRASPWRALLAARFTPPRSVSLAERFWNLYCHLRAHGVGTPEPLAVGTLGRGLVARAGFLVTRELEGFEALPSWLLREREPALRARGWRALALAFTRLRGARVFLPRIERAHVFLSPEEESPAARSAREAPVPGRMTQNRLPSVAIADVSGGSIRPRLTEGEIALMLGRLLGEPGGKAEGAASPREVARFLAGALEGLERSRARTIARRALGGPR